MFACPDCTEDANLIIYLSDTGRDLIGIFALPLDFENN